MRRILELLDRFNTITGIAILFGVPVSIFTGIGSAVWGHFEHLRLSYIAVLTLLIFGLTLWSWIGLIWIFDRAKTANPTRSEPVKQNLECAWGLLLENAIIRTEVGNEVERQVCVSFRNTLPWPVRAEIISRFLEIDNTTPDMPMAFPLTPFIVMPGQPITMNFPGYSKGRIPDKERIKGKIDLVVKYGHPDIGYSRVMSRWWHFEQAMKPNIPDGFFPGLAIMPVPIVALNAGPYKEDEDKPFTEAKITSLQA